MSGAPDFLEAVVGFRAWHVDEEGRLGAWSFRHHWRPGVNDAVCLRDPRHAAPVGSCMCGLYGLTDPSDRRLNFLGDQVVGAIAAWGDMEVHRTGFRAQHARIVALASGCGDLEHEHRLQLAAGRYGVPIVPPRGLSAAAREHGTALPDDLWDPGRTGAHPAGPSPAAPDVLSSARGLAPEEHLWVEAALGTLVIGLTPAFAAQLDDGGSPQLPAPGSRLRAGDRVATLAGRDGAMAVWAPVDGLVAAVNPRLVAEPGLLRHDPEGGGWILRLTVDDAALRSPALDWAPAGRAAYRRRLAGAQDAFADQRLRFLHVVPRLTGAREVRAALRGQQTAEPDLDEVVARLEAALRAAGGSLPALGGRVAWTTTAPAGTLTLDLDHATASRPGSPAGAQLHLLSDAETLQAWADGRLDVALALRSGRLRSDRPAPATLRVLAVLKHLQRHRHPPRAPSLGV